MRIEARGQLVAPHRYSLCWAPIEQYSPRIAEELAENEPGRHEDKQLLALPSRVWHYTKRNYLRKVAALIRQCGFFLAVPSRLPASATGGISAFFALQNSRITKC
jgi:hypothetical protein